MIPPESTDASALPNLPARLFAIFVVLAGLPLLLAGIYLATLGGSVFYAVYGLLLVLASVLLWRRRRLGAWAMFPLLALALIWALWEAGMDGWALLPRLGLGVLLAAVAALLLLRRRKARLIFAGVFVLLLAGTLAVPIANSLALEKGVTRMVSAPATEGDGEWPVVGRNPAADRFSPLADITPENVSRLKVAWATHLGQRADGTHSPFEATPIMVGDTLYTCDIQSRIVALDPDTGKVRWRFTPGGERKQSLMGVCRGVVYHEQAGATGPCAARVVIATQFARMDAVDAHTGRPCADFGVNGEVDLSAGMGDFAPGQYSVTSAPALVRGKLVVGGFVMDGFSTGLPSGVIRAFDVVTGDLAWAWDMGHPDRKGLPPEGETYTRGTPNSWAPMTADEELGLVYVPTGNATPDYLNAHRSDAANRYATSTVAIDAETGEVRWSYQQVHRDVWDYDNASAPTLFDFPTANGPVPALVQPTKRGEFFVLDRRTGKPLVETVEKPVPASTVPGEHLSPTQPYPVGMPSFAGERLTEADMWGISPFDQLWCRIRFRQARYDGEFTPLGADKPSIVYPGFLGGAEWGGVAIDTDRRIMVVNVNHFPMYNRLIPRADRKAIMEASGGNPDKSSPSFAPQTGTSYAVKAFGFLSPLDIPCSRPPYGEIAAVDLAARQTVWRKPLGTARDGGPFYTPTYLPITMGVPNVGGALVTRSGLTFIGATQERTFRALDTRTGALLWFQRLPGAAHANPMTYRSKKTGRQYVVVAASGHFLLHSGRADELIAFALPEGDAR